MPKIFGDFLGYFEKHLKWKLSWLFWTNFSRNWATLKSNIWSHCLLVDRTLNALSLLIVLLNLNINLWLRTEKVREKLTQASRTNVAIASNVFFQWYRNSFIVGTRWWNKKVPNFDQKLPKKYLHTFYMKVTLLELAQKVTKIFGLLLWDNLLPRTCKNRQIWSHWSGLSVLLVREALLAARMRLESSHSVGWPVWRKGIFSFSRGTSYLIVGRRQCGPT